MLVVQRQQEEGLQPRYSKVNSTARGFLGRHHPVLSCKGDVLVPVSATGPGKPMRAPPGFPGRMASAVPTGPSHVWCVWVQPKVGDRAGGLRTARLGDRGAPEVRGLTSEDAVRSIDAVEWDGGVEVAWIERREWGCCVLRARIDESTPSPRMVQVEITDAAEVVFATGIGEAPWLVVCTDGDALVAIDDNDKVVHDTRGST